jgi:LysM repeat protein
MNRQHHSASPRISHKSGNSGYKPFDVSSTSGKSEDQKKPWYIVLMDMIKKNWMIILVISLIIIMSVIILSLTLSHSTNKQKTDSNPVCYYTVGPSDTLESIATQLQTPDWVLQNSNPSIDFTNLQAGSKLVIPGGVCYTTVSGDTCDSIANKYNITVSMLQSMNPSLSCDTIIAGQTLLVMTPGMYSPAPMSTLPLTN